MNGGSLWFPTKEFEFYPIGRRKQKISEPENENSALGEKKNSSGSRLGDSWEKGDTKRREHQKLPGFWISNKENPLKLQRPAWGLPTFQRPAQRGDCDKTVGRIKLQMDHLLHTFHKYGGYFSFSGRIISLWSGDSSLGPLSKILLKWLEEEPWAPGDWKKTNRHYLLNQSWGTPDAWRLHDSDSGAPCLVSSGSFHPATTYSHCHNTDDCFVSWEMR